MDSQLLVVDLLSKLQPFTDEQEKGMFSQPIKVSYDKKVSRTSAVRGYETIFLKNKAGI